MHKGGPLPIGSLHVRDFAELRQQVPLRDLTADEAGLVWFECTACPRQESHPLSQMRARFHPDAGLVNILNALKPKDCPKARPDPWGNHPCGFRYRDLGRRP
jgi:hypothetical protein